MPNPRKKKIHCTTKSYGDNKYDLELVFFNTDIQQLQLPVKDAAYCSNADPDNWHDTFWAVDSANQCWYGKEHCMESISSDKLMSHAELGYKDKVAIAVCLGKSKPWPSWAHKAYSEGWTPPKDWTP